MSVLNLRALTSGVGLAAIVALAIHLGSGGLRHFDPALYWYAVGSIVAAFAVAYRFTIWAERPPSRMYFKRGLQLLFRRIPPVAVEEKVSNRARDDGEPSMPKAFVDAGLTLGTQFVVQDFIRKRSLYRWVMHLCLSGGCTLAFAVTFPLVFGWVYFKTPAHNAEIYEATIFGVKAGSFGIHSLQAFLTFNLLNISAVIVMIGLVMAGYRRLTDAGERAKQTFFEDILPLLIILAVTATGLMLTASYALMGGAGHGLIAIVHMLSVLLLLFYIPFGKLFHIFQRTAHLFVRLYKRAGESGPRAHCHRCKEDFASLMHVEDLKTVTAQLDLNFRYEGDLHYQDICPPCRRRLLAVNQGATIGR